MGVAVADSGGTAMRRRLCICSKEDILPEESFKSWGNYIKALKETPMRLKDRITTRSLEQTELNEVRARSQNEMKRNLTWWDLIWFGIGAVIGAGIFVLTGLEAKKDAGPAVVLSYMISGISAMLAVFCYTEFAVEIPVAGGSFAYLRVELGDLVAYIAAGNILLEYVIANAAVARSWTSYFATLLNHHPDDFRIIVDSLPSDYNHLDPIAVVIVSVICILAALSTKGSSRFNFVASIIHLLVILFIVVAGFTLANPSNLSNFAPYGIRGIFKASAVLFFAYIGFDAIATMAEETKNPAQDIPVGLVGAMSVTTLVYCLLALTLCLMQHYSQIDVDAPFSVAFQATGMGWAKYVVAFGALKGMTTVLLVGAVGQARYVTHIARTHMIPPSLARVHGRTGTPINATVLMMLASGVIALFTELEILSNLLSLSTLFIFVLVGVALLVRRYYVSGVTCDADRNKLIAFVILIVASSAGIAAYWGTSHGWMGYAVLVPVWFGATLGLKMTVPQAREPRLWGVPMVPWLPSASIAIDMLLMGSIDGESYVRFAVWTVILLLYYVFMGLHASYDTAKEAEEERSTSNNQVQVINGLEDGFCGDASASN